MKFESRHLLKWIDAGHSASLGLDVQVFNRCVLTGSDVEGQVRGFTVLEMNDLKPIFFERLRTRKRRGESPELSFVLQVPSMVEKRASELLASNSDLGVALEVSPFFSASHAEGVFRVRRRVRVVNVDDSPVLLKFLRQACEELGFVDVVGQVSQPRSAVETIVELGPDVVTMDIQMPGKTGVDVVRELMARQHFPVIMISSLGLEEGTLVFDALNAGAFDYLGKPRLEELDSFRVTLAERVLAAIEGRGAHQALQRATRLPVARQSSVPLTLSTGERVVWCLGASTGGTQALTNVFTGLPAQIPPTLVVQHIPPVFSRAFADSLNKLCPFTVKEATDGEELLANHVYIAPGGLQMGVVERQGRIYLALRDEAPVNRFKPSVDYMFRDVAKLSNLHVVAGLFTGMGKDGAAGLLELRALGARTLAQDEASSTVYGMPRAAADIGAAERIVSLETAPQELLKLSVAVAKRGSLRGAA